jgi:spore photoproduct lyase
MECSYCILQVYFNNPYLTIFTNIEKMIYELSEADKTGKCIRVGSGEFTDSFALSTFANWNETLIPFFAKSKNMFIELKSKLADRDFLKYKNHNRRTIISFSLNSLNVHKNEEFLSSSVEERIKTAKEAFENGFINSFHFDPIIDYHGCEEEYEDIVDLIFDNIPAKNICWISLGSLRFIPMLKEIATDRFPKSKIYFQEFHTGIDGKFRYFIERRIEIYKKITKHIRKRSKTTPLYFCMENSKVWKRVFGMV